ncbi:ogr/Delta-like zinc finger family protein [Stenotrophomonas rhizophila]
MSAEQSRAFLRCPHCESAAIVRTSCSHNKLLRESLLQCKNVVCGHTFSAYTEIVKTISPSSARVTTLICPCAASKSARRTRSVPRRTKSPMRR